MVVVEVMMAFQHWTLCVGDQVSHNCAFAWALCGISELVLWLLSPE